MNPAAGSILTAGVVLTLIVSSVFWSGDVLADQQIGMVRILLIVCGYSMTSCFIAGEITHNCSQTDKLLGMLDPADDMQGGLRRIRVRQAWFLPVCGVNRNPGSKRNLLGKGRRPGETAGFPDAAAGSFSYRT